MTVDEAQRIADAFAMRFRGNLPVKLAVVDKPEDVYGQQARPRPDGRQPFEASYHASRGLIFIFAAAVHTEASCRRAIRHELFGHFGLNTFTPDAKRAFLDRVSETRSDPELKATWAMIDATYRDKPEPIKAEEVFAFVVENEQSFSQRVVDRLLVGLNGALRAIGAGEPKMTAAELRVCAHKISEGIRKGRRQQKTFPADDQAQFRRGRI